VIIDVLKLLNRLFPFKPSDGSVDKDNIEKPMLLFSSAYVSVNNYYMFQPGNIVAILHLVGIYHSC
jgi:hypothetical protein